MSPNNSVFYNSHCRKVLCESANSIARSNPYRKSKRLLSRQAGQDPDVIAYADRGTARIKKKFINLRESGKATNVALPHPCDRNRKQMLPGCPGRLTTVKILPSSRTI